MRKHFILLCGLLWLALSPPVFAQPSEFFEKGYSDDWFEKGKQAHLAGDLQRAADCYHEAVYADSTNLDARFNLGLVHFTLNNYSKARIVLGKLLEMNPHDAAAAELLGTSLYHLGRYDQAVAAFDIAAQTQPSADIYANRGLANMAAGNAAAAIRDFEAALQLEPQNFAACLGKGNALVVLDQPQLALSWFEKAASINPQKALVPANQALAYFNMGETSTAFVYFDEALALERSAAILTMRAECLLAAGDEQKANEDLIEAQALSPEDGTVSLLLEKMEMPQNRQDPLPPMGSEEPLPPMGGEAPASAAALLESGNAKAENQRWLDAIQDYKKALTLEPGNPEAKSLMMLAYKKMDEANAAWLAKANEKD